MTTTTATNVKRAGGWFVTGVPTRARAHDHFGFFGGARIVLYNLPTFLATSADFNAFLAAVTPFFAVLAVLEMMGPLYGSISARSSNTRTV